MKRLFCLLHALVFGGAALLSILSPAYAQDETRVSVVNTTVIEYRLDNENTNPDDDNYGNIIERLNLLASSGDISISSRLDGMLFLSPPELDPQPFRDDMRLERITATYNLEAATITAGDFYQQLGRGTMLSIRKVPEVGVDVALRGGRVTTNLHDDLTLLVFGGRTNPANLDNVSLNFIEDTDDIVGGGQLEYSGLDFATIGLYSLYMQPNERILPEERDWTRAAGGFIELPSLTDFLSLYIEGNGQERALAGVGERGYSFYSTADLALGDTNILLEGIVLNAFELRGSTNTSVNSRTFLNQPPTLERIDQEILNTRDVEGARTRVEHYFAWDTTDLTLYVNGMLRFTDPNLPDTRVRQTHIFGGSDFNYQDGSSHIYLSGGFRDEVRSENGVSLKNMIHFETDWVQSLSERYALHLASLTELRDLLIITDGSYQDWNRGSIFAGLEVSSVGTFTMEYGFDNLNPEAAQHFLAGIVSWNISENFELRSIAGTQRGGLKCIAGVCREFPGFAGTRAEIIGKF